MLVIVYDVFDNHFDVKDHIIERLHHRHESRTRREVKLTSSKIKQYSGIFNIIVMWGDVEHEVV